VGDSQFIDTILLIAPDRGNRAAFDLGRFCRCAVEDARKGIRVRCVDAEQTKANHDETSMLERGGTNAGYRFNGRRHASLRCRSRTKPSGATIHRNRS
jgi:hypothetical protein